MGACKRVRILGMLKPVGLRKNCTDVFEPWDGRICFHAPLQYKDENANRHGLCMNGGVSRAGIEKLTMTTVREGSYSLARAVDHPVTTSPMPLERQNFRAAKE